MSYQDNGTVKDNDIHVITRDNDYPHNEALDTPNFINSLDMPTPGQDNPLFDNLNGQAYQGHPADFLMSPGLGPLTDFVNELNNDLQIKEEDPNYGALTKFNNPLPPLPQLSELVIPKSIPMLNPIIPEYMQNGLNSSRPPALLNQIKKKKDSQGPKTRPAFVLKIWSMVNDPTNHDYIRWNEDGKSFKVVNREEFMKRILPKYFKHNNFASFVRQLNMYGWHKMQDVSSGSMKDDRNLEEVLLFENPYFIRGREELLDSIVRNKAGAQETESSDSSMVNFLVIMSELDQIKMNQIAIIEDMRRIRKDNLTLWNESFTARERHQKQSGTLDKIMKFLAAVYGNSAGKIFEVENGHFDPNYNNQVSAYNNEPNNISSGMNGSTADPNNTELKQPAPVLKPRLMLMDQAYRNSSSLTGSYDKTPSEASARDSVEEIVRNNSFNADHHSNLNKIYQQIMNQEMGSASPRHNFAEMNLPHLRSSSPAPGRFGKQEAQDDTLSGLEQNIFKQGQALLQVQDWIQTLANRQQQQQSQLQQQKSLNVLPNDTGLDDFDVNEFLDSSYSKGNQGSTPLPDERAAAKRQIEEVNEDDGVRRSKRRR